MSTEIVINVEPFETRVALLENHTITEIFLERNQVEGITGNIYWGKVTKVLPGMQVAFVDIGEGRSAFLHQRDINPKRNDMVNIFLEDGEEPDEVNLSTIMPDDENKEMTIEEMITEGQEIMVQVNKGPIGSKGARVSNYVSLPGRYMVLLPLVDQVGVSRRISSDEERSRLKSIVEGFKEQGKGFIIRTAAEGATAEEIKQDINFLQSLWKDIVEKHDKVQAPTPLHKDLDIILRSMRDLPLNEVKRVTIDNLNDHDRCVKFIDSYMTENKPEIEYYSAMEPIFDAFDIEIDIEKAIGRKVWLKSGGSIVIDQTEALTTIDVNTGKFVGKNNQEETILKTNLEAIKESVYQIKLRNIGGIIIIDFIDMEQQENKEKVYNILEQALRMDRSRTKILQVSELGLVEMTRKRTRNSLTRTICEDCPHCDGKGFVKSLRTICYEIFREIKRTVAKNPTMQRVMLKVSPEVSASIIEDEDPNIELLEERYGINISIKTVANMPEDSYEVTNIDLA